MPDPTRAPVDTHVGVYHGVTVVSVVGEVDASSVAAVDDAVAEALRGDPRVLVMDLHEVSFLASAGLSSLLRAQRACQPRTELRVVAGSRVTHRPIEVTGLDARLAVFASLDDAAIAEE